MESHATGEERWQHLVGCAFGLEEGAGKSGSVADVLRTLDSVLEVFPSHLDPLEDFQGYAVRRLAVAMRNRLATAAEPPARKKGSKGKR